ncbi:hypothetical protein B2M26_00715 [Ferroacidibacillus organovorans]|uniref:Uncharacterized protein n=1 Tax=Ferroacidibacillus organovorans TaxID=1765683 RepID=A0A1V4EXT3_9BACL|nr:hypothetical protein B2M26_00715 [Ferroacidibacillus organovorans]
MPARRGQDDSSFDERLRDVRSVCAFYPLINAKNSRKRGQRHTWHAILLQGDFVRAVLQVFRTIGYKLGISAITFLSGVLVTRYFASLSDRGTYALVTSTLLFGSTFLSGYGAFVNYGLNRLKLDRSRLLGVLSRLYLQLASVIVALLIVSVSLTHAFSVFFYISFILAVLPFVILYNYSSRLLQALNEISWVNRMNMVQASLFLVGAAVLYGLNHARRATLSPHLLVITLILWLCTNITAAALIVPIARARAGTRFTPRRDEEVSKPFFAYGNRISWQNLLTQLNYRGDFYAVGILAGSRGVALYTIAVTASEILWQVSQSISLAVFARIAKEERHASIELTERSFRFTFYTLISGAVIMFACSPLIDVVYTHRYQGSIAPFQILLIGTTAYGATGLLTQFFTDQLGHVRFPLYMQAASIATNVLICVIAIPHLGIVGGALASSTAYFLALTLSVLYYRRHTNRSLRNLFFFTHEDRLFLRRFTPRRRSLSEGSK